MTRQAEHPEPAALRRVRPTDESDTRLRLIEASGPVFAERGFRNATVRDICAAAGANIAAINYHFGDKLGLYRAVLTHLQAQANRQYMDRVPESGSPDARLTAWISAFLHKILNPERPAWQVRLMLREMVEPTDALDHMVESSIRPQWDQLRGIVAGVLRVEPDAAVVWDCAASVVGQCVLHRHCGSVIRRLRGGGELTVAEIDHLAAHIASFSAGALKSLRSGGAARQGPSARRPAKRKAGAR